MNLCVPIWWVDALPVAAWEAKLVHSGSLRTLGLDDSKCSSWWLPPSGRACAHRASQPCTFTCLRCSTSPRCLQDLPWQHSESPRVSLRHQGEGKEAEQSLGGLDCTGNWEAGGNPRTSAGDRERHQPGRKLTKDAVAPGSHLYF